MTKEELREKEKAYQKNLETCLPKYKAYWERQLKHIKKQLYGST